MGRGLLRFFVNVCLFACFLAFAAAYEIKTGRIDIAPAWNPWLPLDLTLRETRVQTWKIRRARNDPAQCVAALAHVSSVTAMPDYTPSPKCSIEGGVVLAGLGSARLAPVKTRCALAMDLYLWEQNSVRPAARDIFGAGVREIEHFSSYSCRKIAGSRYWSKHARAEAIDIAGFWLANGRHITLLRGWNGKADEQKFLRRIRDGACDYFGGVLSPDYNAAHADHFHFDFSAWGFCR
jgi:hypothetical protein